MDGSIEVEFWGGVLSAFFGGNIYIYVTFWGLWGLYEASTVVSVWMGVRQSTGGGSQTLGCITSLII